MRKNVNAGQAKRASSDAVERTVVDLRERLSRARARIFVPILIVIAFACGGGDPTDNLPADCDAYVSTAESCYRMDKDRALEMRQVFRSRLVAATDKQSVINECSLGIKQLAKVCHAL